MKASSGSIARTPGPRRTSPTAAGAASTRGARRVPIGTTWASVQTAVATSIVRDDVCAARKEPATGPTTQPAVNAIRTTATTPSSPGRGWAVISSWTAANSCEVAAPANASTTALRT